MEIEQPGCLEVLQRLFMRGSAFVLVIAACIVWIMRGSV
jgi:hypothetical protein